MASYETNNDIVGGGGFGYGGGMFAMIILLVVVFWVLFRGRDGVDGHRDGYGYGFGGGCGCGPCVRPSFIDESNFEEERNINSKLCKVDEDVWKNGCKDREATHCEGEKTRQLIEQNYIQDLRDQLSEKNSMIQTMKSEAFTAAQIGLVNHKIEKVDEMIERLMCELPKRPPVFAECVTPNTHDIDCGDRFRDRDFGRRGRGRCDFDDFCCA